ARRYLCRCYPNHCSAPMITCRCALTGEPTRPTLNHMVQYANTAQPGPPPMHETFAALADPTRLKFLERLRRSDASITQLAQQADISLTGTKKHVGVLESAGLVSTRKEGRTRICTLGRRGLEQ